ncbi:MAG TPA: P1 family peptidase, partial [Gemmatimonadales bacterium]|nr:P1 family peptidase [Gemmatimonadales bacterium]
PLSDRNLERVARRALLGLARTGSSASNGSGDYVIAFATNPEVRREQGKPIRQVSDLDNEAMSPIFQAVVEATEEAIYNSLFRATTVTGSGHTVTALPIDSVKVLLQEYHAADR